MATILIVEDDIDTNEAVCEYLQEAGHTTIPAFDGNEAITLFASQKIDLLVLDIMLPTVTGLVALNSMLPRLSLSGIRNVRTSLYRT